MASQAYDISERGNGSGFLTMEYYGTSGSTAQLHEFPELVTEAETGETVRGVGLFRAIFLALSLEVLAGVGIYQIWNLWHISR